VQTLFLLLAPALLTLAPVEAEGHAACPLSAVVEEVAAQALQEEPFADAALLGWKSEPTRLLIAQQNGPEKITLRVVGPDGKAVSQEVLTASEEEPLPEFKAAALRAWPKVRDRMKEQGMERGRSADIEPGARAVLSISYEKKETVYVLVLADREEEIFRHPRKARAELYPYFPPGRECFALVGSVTDGEGIATGTTVVQPLPAKAGALSDAKLAEAWFKDAQNRIEYEYYVEAGALLHKALQRRSDAETQFTAALVDAYLGEWEGARAKLDGAIKAGGETWTDRAHQEPLLREARLRGLDFNRDRSLTFKASKGFEGTSVWVKVKDSEGRNVAIFKPTNGNTYHRGEVFTYQVAKLLRIEKLYPVTILYTLDKEGCDKFAEALDKVTYKGMKERNRERLIRVCRKGGLEGAVKEWVLDFQFLQAIGTQDKLKRHRVFKHLQHNRAHPAEGETVRVKTVTRLYKPDHCKQATYKGTLDLAQFARDVSDLLIVDVLNANEDRFPGANVDFKSLGRARETSTCVFDFGPARLFSLDNGATFKGTYSNGYVDFTKRVKPSRFNRRTYRRLKEINAFVKGEGPRPRFLAHWGIESVDDLSRFLALDKGDDHKRRKEPFKLFTTNLRYVLTRLDQFKKNKDAWFK
jgi:tetratricopeptide (TPR) repeat protein